MAIRGRFFELSVLAALLVQFGGAFAWVVRTWSETTYESWGFVALLVLAVVARRGIPRRRPSPSMPHLCGVLGLAMLDLLLTPLSINVVSAGLGLVAVHLWLVTFRDYQGRWFLQPQLWLALLCLPVVFWANILFGYQLQHLVSRLAAGCLGLYGLPVTAEGTVLQLPGAVVAVDSSCSGLKLLYSGVLFGVVVSYDRAPPRHTAACLSSPHHTTAACCACSGATPGGPMSLPRRALFWLALFALLLGANVMRVLSLAVGQLQLGRPVEGWAHEGVGLVAFAMVAAAALWLWRRLGQSQRRPVSC
jgi:exosortase/archaeosortase family protein